ncbi:MAG: DJ-1/PfpI family protein [Candidatus Hodarchaeota archaeon]
MKINQTRLVLIFLLSIIIFPGYKENKSASAMHVNDVRIVAFIADGFDYSELMKVKGYLTEWEVLFTVAGLEGELTSHKGKTITSDMLILEVNISNYDCLFVPGGSSPYVLIENQTVIDLVQEANSSGLILAAICHGPLVLIKADVVRGKVVTETLKKKEAVVITGNIVTANFPYFKELSLAMAKALGISEENPPTILEVNLEINESHVNYFFLSVVASDDSKVDNVKAEIFKIKESGNNTFKESFNLIFDNKTGEYSREFNIKDRGEYLIDIIATDCWGNKGYLKECKSCTVIGESESSSSASSFPTMFPLLSVLLLTIEERNDNKI